MEQKVMAQRSGKDIGATQEIARDTNTSVVPGDYHEFSGSNAKMYTTYDNRISTLEAALGNKDSVKG